MLRRISKRREVSSIVALVAPLRGERPRLYARHFKGSIHGADVVEALRYFRLRVGRPLVVVWDNLKAHSSGEVLAFVATHPKDFKLEWLPPYAPDINPEEGCNNIVKRSMLNSQPDTVEELQQQVRWSFIRLGRRSDILRKLFPYAHLLIRGIT